MSRLSLGRMTCIVFACCASMAIPSAAQTFTTLASFDWTNGGYPDYVSLVQGTDGDFYGTTDVGGAYGYGAIFKICSSGKLVTLYSFCAAGYPCADGYEPEAGLVQDGGGNFYGTTSAGGANGDGTVFQITPAGKLTTLHSFDGTDGSYPEAGLVVATNGDIYGTTSVGGEDYQGTVFKITAGTLTTLHSFDVADGSDPRSALIQATNGNLYGETLYGGAYDSGTVFEMTAGGALTTLYSFCAQTNCPDGNGPYGGLVQGANGNFYGTTISGGAYSYGTVFEVSAATGTLTTLYSFCAEGYPCPDGDGPIGQLIQATDGNFYGTTTYGGTNNDGTIFKITSAGTLTTLHTFDGSDGSFIFGGLIQATGGIFYGPTFQGGASNDGSIFRLSTGLRPFVKTEPASGKVGAKVIILGNGLTGTTSVSFNGTAATFTVVRGSEIVATVPTGATTGAVEVTTPKGTLKSNVAFQVP